MSRPRETWLRFCHGNRRLFSEGKAEDLIKVCQLSGSEMEAVMERECSALGGLFQTVITDMKGSYPVWEDFISKAGKLQAQLRATVMAVAAFLDAFQKVADLATGSREYKRARQEIKKKSADTLKLQKKAKKGRGDLQAQVDSALQGVSDKYASLQETERQAVRKALIEERARFCMFVSMLRPAIEEEVCMLGEITHLQSISDDLRALTMDPHKLPPSSEQVIADLKGSECSWSYQTPPSSPSTTSRKSSMCSSLNSVNSSDSRSSSSHSHSPTSHFRYRGSALPQQGSVRLPSVSSHDSGFTSQDTCQSKSPSPMPPDGNVQLVNGNMSHFISPDPSLFIVQSSPPSSPVWAWSPPGPAPGLDIETCFPLSPGTFPPSYRVPSWKDWARPGPYDQPMVNTLRRVKEKGRENCESSSSRDEAQKASPNSGTHTKPRDEAHEELAMCLSRGLSLDIPRSSRESVQGSSGYSTQTNTPCCSEDTYIFDYECLPGGGDQEGESQDCDTPAPLVQNTDISHSYRRNLPAKRPSPCGPVSITPGVATIRRAPTSKPSLWRGPSVHGPIPIKTPVVPVKTPTVPQSLSSGDTENPSDPPPSPSEQTPNVNQSDAPAERDKEGPDVMMSSMQKGLSIEIATNNERSAPVLD
ncbi:Metastasis suppressor protein 1 [Bagarius yarrelli]|uniref:Metastasis suppressor protein 1 n=1 Tax=Bagarius yarrelli TaxID=175774 RepID=A0A556UYY5_BAGYA|nr:Metastasis suppressor protein 1 [Bagarius yarrelli]